MKHIQIPAPVEVEPIGPDGKVVKEKDGSSVMYSLEKLNEQNVWQHEYWRKDAASMDLFDSIYEKFTASKYVVGSWVSLTDEEYEAYKPLATMAGEKIRPDIAPGLNKIMGAIIRAKTKLPEIQVAEAKSEN